MVPWTTRTGGRRHIEHPSYPCRTEAREPEIIKALVPDSLNFELAGQCELFYFDESGFSPNPPIQYGWSCIGQVRSVEPQSHRQRVDVLGALRQDSKPVLRAQQRPTVRNDVIAFFDRLSEAPHSSPRIVVIDNAAIHKGNAMESKRQQWADQGLYLYYLPAYSPELNRIEIL